MRFRIEYSPECIEEIESIPKNVQGLVKRAIVERLMVDPISYGKPLKYSLKGIRSLRVSSYRILYQVIMENDLVRIVKVAIRRDVYE
jgi:mRNA interferase RelE/StbE